MSEKNLSIWSQVEKTDTRYTKEAKVGGQQITSLNGTAMIMKATEIFGPAGIGFGWSVLEERFDKGAEIFSGEGDKRVSLGFELNHTVKIQFWFKQDGQRGEIEQYGCTPYLYKSKYGTTTDGEAPKKSLTDAIKKSLSMLGFSADVFLGMFDDRDYVQQLQSEQAIEQAEDREAEIEKQKQERLDYLKSVVDTMQGAQSAQELKRLHDHAVRRLTARKDTSGVKRIAKELQTLSPKFAEGETK
ncbi:DNA binding protein [Pseudomonas phage AH02]|nr:DNA binding protein [Pseudomonas phage AH02]